MKVTSTWYVFSNVRLKMVSVHLLEKWRQFENIIAL